VAPLRTGFSVFTLLAGAVIVGLQSSCTPRAAARTEAGGSRTVPPTHYQVVHNWPIVPNGELLGAVAGVGVDTADNVFIFRRAGRAWPASDTLDITPIARPTVLLFDHTSGKLLDSWGAKQFAMPHGLTVDHQNNVWLTDVALQQVYKFTHDGHLLLTLGQRGVAGNDSAHFNRPTDVAVNPDGSFYVSDGYLNTRVLKFAADGRFLFQWGTKGSGHGQFDLPHGLALDQAGRVYVADRSNMRVQVFDSTGRYLDEWHGDSLGRPYGVAIGSPGLAFVADGGDQPHSPPDRSALVVLSTNGSVQERVGRYGSYDGQFAMAHDVAVGRDGSVYVGDITGQRVQRFVLR
jgi:peptidylamidoglycolate lyase